jgi:hypothetical protein
VPASNKVRRSDILGRKLRRSDLSAERDVNGMLREPITAERQEAEIRQT